MVWLQVWRSEECRVLLPLLTDPLWSGVLVKVKVQFMGKIDPFENNSYPIGLCPEKKTLKKTT